MRQKPIADCRVCGAEAVAIHARGLCGLCYRHALYNGRASKPAIIADCMGCDAKGVKMQARGLCWGCYGLFLYGNDTPCKRCGTRVSSRTKTYLCTSCAHIKKYCINGHNRQEAGLYPKHGCKECGRSQGEWREARKIQAIGLKGGVCKDCGMDFEDRPECAEFDHVKGRQESLTSLKRYSIMNLAWVSVLIELAKCELVCANCHATRTKRRSKGQPVGQPNYEMEVA